ncbi:MAG: HAMP domain-containing sensor histidine kinase, partial [Polyangiaceae bacterium]
RSLHTRLALWMVASTVFTLAAFAVALYVALRIEDADGGAESVTLTSDASEQILAEILVAAPVALLVAAGGALVLSRRALAPLQRVIADARTITTSRLDTRLALPERRDELYDLIDEINRVFARLEVGFGALGRYAADASHELRTPLAVIASELDVALQRPRTSDEWERAAAKALAETRRLARLVDSLLALSRAEGPLDRLVRFDLREQVDQVLASVAEQAAAKEVAITLVADGGAEAAWMEGDADAMASAVRNLVDNALRHAFKGGKVSVAVNDDCDQWLVTVDDSGAGVPAERRETIFSPLSRDATIAPEGYGLGLAITKRIVERHRGIVSIVDAPGGGARFVIAVPHARRTPPPA